MAQLVIAAAGAAIGGMIAPGVVAFGMTGASIGWMAGSMIGAGFGPTQKSEGPRLSDLSVSTSSYGTPIPYVAGSPRVAGQIVWASPKREIATTQSAGGKGGGGSEYTSYTYEVDLLILLTDNEIQGIPQVWSNGELVYSVLSDATSGTINASVASTLWSRLTTYTGASSQLPDPDYEAAVGTANAPAYRGRGSVFIKSLQLGSSGQIPNLTFRVAQKSLQMSADTPTVTFSDFPVYTPASDPTVYPALSPGNPQALWLPSENVWAFWKKPDENYAINNTYKHSTADGVTWTETVCTNNLIPTNNFSDISYGLGKYVASYYAVDLMPMYTTNGGLSWFDCTSTDANAYLTIDSVAFNGSFFLAFGQATSGYIHKSTDGIAFPLIQTITGTTYRYIMWDGVKFIISGVRYISTSTDGVTWTTRVDVSGASTLSGKLIGTSSLLAIDTSASIFTGIYYSTDGGTSWSSTAHLNTFYKRAFWFDGLRFNAICVDLTLTHVYVYSTADFITWTFVEIVDPWSINTGYRNIPISNNNGKSIAITNLIDNNPKRSLICSFSAGIAITVLPSYLPDVVSDVSKSTGLVAAEFDVSMLNALTEVRAMPISQVSSARTVLEMLAQTYHFDAVLSDKIYFKPRATASVATLTFDELGVGIDPNADPLPLTTANELEIPAQMALTYNNTDGDYQTDTQYSDRLLTGQESTSAITVPLGFTASEAKQIVDGVLLDKAVSGLTTKVQLGITRAALEPTDVITITGDDSSTYRMRVVKRTESAGVIELECVQDDATVFTQAGSTSGGTNSQTTIASLATTTLALMDLPCLRDADNQPGLYAAVTGSAANWTSAAIYDSLDDVTYTTQTTVSTQAPIGTCTTTLGAWSGGNTFDETNTVTVNVGLQQLSSTTWDGILANTETNAALVGSELIQYRVATLVSAGVYTLSGLLRGRKGTSSTGHVAAERFVALSTTAGLRFLVLQSADLARLRYYKGVSASQALSAVTAQSITPLGNTLKPFAPVDARANRATTDTVLTWVRQTRLSTRIVGTLPMSIPLGETSESYEVEVWDSGYTTLKRTLTSSTPTATYTNANQVTDFGSGQTVLYLKIYQLSATVGRGTALTVSV